jgi:hypothetical protein
VRSRIFALNSRLSDADDFVVQRRRANHPTAMRSKLAMQATLRRFDQPSFETYKTEIPMTEELSREPQESMEDFEKTEEHVHGHAGHEVHKAVKKARWPALAMAIMCVLGAYANQLSSHEESEAGLTAGKAQSSWAYYQSISTKDHQFESTQMVLNAVGGIEGAAIAKIEANLKTIETARAKYEHQKEETQAEAKALDAEAAHHLKKHQEFNKAAMPFSTALVLFTVSLVMGTTLWAWAGLISGSLGVFFVSIGLFGAFWEGTFLSGVLSPLAALLGVS